MKSPITSLDAAGLSKNETRIYVTLVEHGELSVGDIARHSKVNRRNAYDTLVRLIEKGLVYEVIGDHDRRYSAVDPHKLLELVDEKRNSIEQLLPQLSAVFAGAPAADRVSIHRGVEGLKSYMRDIMHVGEDLYTIGGKTAWTDDRMAQTFKQVSQEAKRKKMKISILFDHGVRNSPRVKTIKEMGANVECRYLPKSFSSAMCVDIFGNHVVLHPYNELGYFDVDATVVHIENRELADGFRKWFQGMWAISKS